MLDSPRMPGFNQATALMDRYHGPLQVIAASLRAPTEVLLNPWLIMPVVVVALDGPATAIGAIVTAAAIGWLIPQLLAERAAHRPWFLAARAGVAVTLALVLAIAGGAGALGPILVLVTAFWALGGVLVAGQPGGLLERPAHADIGSQVALLAGGALAVLTSLAAGRALGPDGASFPGWAVQGALVAALLLGAAAVLTWRDRSSSGWAAPWTDLPLAPALVMHGRRPRRYLVFRLALALAALADPLLIITGLRAFDLPMQAIGVVLALHALVAVAAGVGLPSLVATGHARLMAQLAALARVLVPIGALSIPVLLSASPVVARLPREASWLAPAAWFGLALLLSLAVVITSAADTAYLSEAMAPSHRGAMRGLLVIVLALASVAYVGGGAIADRWGMQPLWLAAALLGVVALLASGLLLDVPPADTRELTDTGALPTFRELHDSA
ncbi:MAG: hypothetical protein IT340_19280 [Chloroflexi bacterium]|nr:hypothetical protein [Chloroflexota bacterium]